MKTVFVKYINKSQGLKKMLVSLNNSFFDWQAIIIGWVITIYPRYKNHKYSQIIAEPGLLGFKGGVFNPGVIRDLDKMLILTKAQKVHWYDARGKQPNSFENGSPVLMTLNKNLKIENPRITTVSGYSETGIFNIEDFRLFQHKEKLMVNHTAILDSENRIIRSVLSCLNPEKGELDFYGIPQLDFQIKNTEKNWVYASGDKNECFLFYSINPYHVLYTGDLSSLKFNTIINRQYNNQLKDPGRFGSLVSFSANPVEIDNENWLQIIHQVKNTSFGRVYYHWGLLTNKKTKTPKKITQNPLFSGLGARGKLSGLRYISSIVLAEDQILFFAGEGDKYITCCKIPLQKIFDQMIEID